MKTIIFILATSALIIGCNNKSSDKPGSVNRVVLRSDTVNVVNLTDTLVIHETACRGCEFEGSTYFGLSDSTDIIQLQEVISKDNNPAEMVGGNISKTIVMFCAKPGKTSFKLYKFLTSNATPKDSALFTRYTVEVKNQ